MRKFQAFYIFFIIPLIGADWQDIVKKECQKASDSDSFLQPGHVYQYRYLASGNAAAVGLSDRSSEIEIDCSVTLSPATSCLYNLDISRCKASAKGGVEGSEEYWIRDHDLSVLTKYPVLFSLNNGKLGSVFADPEDPLFSVNIKRGIISGFAVSKSSTKEFEQPKHRDIHGTCPLRTYIDDENHFTSFKDIVHCSFPSRPDWHLSPWSLFWNMSFIQYLIKSSVKCDYTVNVQESKLEKVSCHERHAILLDSSEDTANSVQTNVRYLLALEDASKVLYKHRYTLDKMRSTGIEFEHGETPEPETQPPDFLNKAQQLLSDLVLSSQDEVQIRAVTMFHELIALLRESYDVIPFIDSVTSCSFLKGVRKCNKHQKELALNFLKDAVVQCNTVACMKGIRHLIVREQVSRMYLNFILLSWTNIQITKPAYIEEILSICKHTEMKLCWLTLGTVIHKYSEHHSEIPEPLKETVSYLLSYISDDCNVEDVTFPAEYTTADKNEYLITVLKTIGNMGDVARLSNHGIVRQLYSCVSGKETLQEVSIAAVRAMHRMKPSNYIHKKLLFILKDNSRLIGVRLASYDILVQMFNDDELAKEMAVLLREEKSKQVRCYIASDVEMILSEGQDSGAESFANRLKEKLKEEGVYLEDIICSPFRQSSSHRHSSFFDMEFLPKDIRGFGAKWDHKVIFDTLSAFPYSSSFNYTTELFSKLHNLVEVGVLAKHWEEFGIWIRRQLSDPNIRFGEWIMPNFMNIVRKLGAKGLVPVIPQYGGDDIEFVYPDQKVADNLHKVLKQYFDSNIKHKPTLQMYLKMFGNEVGFVTLNGMFSFISKYYQWLANQNLVDSLKKGITYNVTRSLTLIEAYHHVPTLMGLPINWSTNCTYIISPRISIDANTRPGERTENFNIQYSEAFTLLNRMILDFPTVTQIGVQANTSTHASLEYAFTFHHSDNNHLTEVTLHRSPKEQKYFELYRTNQQIQHDKIDDLPDFIGERITDKKCCSVECSEIFGFKTCSYNSYISLPDEKKPSTFMAGSVKSTYILQPYDKDLKYYKLSIIRPPTERNVHDIKIKFKAPGEKYTREVKANAYWNHNTKEGTLEILATDFPEFQISSSRSRILSDDDVPTGIRHHWLIQFNQDKKYEMTYNFNEVTESRPLKTGHGRHARSKEFLATIRERTLDLQTPYNVYRWASKLNSDNGTVKTDATLSYENLVDGWNWPKTLLPKTVWETDKKAWLQYEGDWEVQSDKDTSDHFHRHTINRVNSPKRSLEIVTHRIQMPGRIQISANSTVTEVESGRHLSFVNFTYDTWQSGNAENEKDIRKINLMIPRYTWNFNMERDIGASKRFVTFVLRRTKTGSGEITDWWDIPENTDDISVSEIKYKGIIEQKFVQNKLLPQRILESEHIQDKDRRYPGKEITFDLILTYPNEGKEEKITMKGKMLNLYKQLPIGNTMSWMDSDGSEFIFDGYTSLSDRRREVRGVSASRQNWIKRLMLYNDVIYQGGEKKSEYNLNLLWGDKEKCEYLDLKHGFTSSVYIFDSTVLLKCQPRSKAYHLEINVETKSPKWEMLDSRTHQIFFLERHLNGWETMNFTHPVLKIDAEGKVGMDFEGPFYNKKYSIKSKTDLIPSAEIAYNSKLTTTAPYMELIIEAPEEKLKRSNFRVEIARDGSGLTSVGSHIHTDAPDEEHQHSSFSLKLLSPFKYSVNGYYDLKFVWAVGEWLKTKALILRQKINAIVYNPDHPVHEIGRFIKNITIKEKEFLNRVRQNALRNRLEIRRLLLPFVEPYIEFGENVRRELRELSKPAVDYYQTTSVSGYTIKHFELTEKGIELLEKVPILLMSVAKSYVSNRDNTILSYHYTGPHPFYWPSLFQPPRLWEGTWRLPVFYYLPHVNSDLLFRQRYLVSPYHKTAMIFGPHHVYTFDGRMYEFPNYPIADCTYMLAHDVRESSFSILSSESKLHMLFPELTITIAPDQKIYVNNSKHQSAVPLESPNGKVSVTREGRIITVSTIGLKVLCDPQRMFCIFVLDPLHHSGTMGLLGNADGEAFNDFTLPDGRSVETSAELARGYEVSNRKKCRQIQEKQKPEQWQKDVQTRCAQKFPQKLSDCAAFLEIDENDFKEACRWDITQEKDICFSADAFAGYCTVHGVKSQPCSESPNWHLKTVTSAHKLEVILVIDEHSSVFSTGLKGLESLLGAIEEEFRKNEYDSIVYSVVGFGGDGVRWDPHIKTPNTEMWHSQKDVTSFLNKVLAFDGKTRSDALAAVNYAATILPFEMQSSRIMLLFTVDDVDSYLHGLKVKYLHKLLDSKSITLYTFADFPTIDKGKKVFGVRADGLIFPQPRKGESYMDFPKTEKAKLTSATRGSIFLRRFAEANEPYAFYKIAAEEFYAKVGKEVSKCRKCSWRLNDWWDVQHECELAEECDEQ